VNRVQQILHNLVGNAVKSTKEGRITVSARETEGMVEVTVADTGPGVPANQREAIWLSFRQADGTAAREAGGTGLELPITKTLVELHGGEIRLESEEGSGSRFVFTLPVWDGDAAAPRETAHVARPAAVDSAEETPAQGRGAKILFVDDEAVNRHVVKRQLGNAYALSLADGGEAALKAMGEDLPELVLLDVMMPGMDGYEVCRRIRERWSAARLPVILVTARNQVTDLVAGLKAGANDYIAKPYTGEELRARIERHLATATVHAAQGRFVPADLASALGRLPEDLGPGDRLNGTMTLLEVDLGGSAPGVDRFDTVRGLSETLFSEVAKHRGLLGGAYGDALLCVFPHGSLDALETAVAVRALDGSSVMALHHGPLTFGAVGGGGRLREFCDTPLLGQMRALRVLGRTTGTRMLASEPVVAGVNGQYPRRVVGRISGGTGPVEVYELLGPETRRAAALNQFEAGLAAFWDRRFEEAAHAFAEVLKADAADGVAEHYRRQAVAYALNPPPEEWQGVVDLQTFG
jgi:two-component system sensor histidine kinase ChiS